MKKSHIIAIIAIAIAIGILMSTAEDASSYVNFDQAYQLAVNGKSTGIHVVGEVKKDVMGKIVGLEKSSDNLSFTFFLVDDNKHEQKVFYNEPVPADFGRSEKIVVIGNYVGEDFVAKKIILKCPSKYQEQKLNAGI